MHIGIMFFLSPVPDPPANLSINVRHGRPVSVKWDPPVVGGFSKFKLRLIPLNEGAGGLDQPRSFIEEKTSLTLPDLKPGASYEIQLFTIFENKESTAYMSGNFTTSKSPHLSNHLSPHTNHPYTSLLCDFQNHLENIHVVIVTVTGLTYKTSTFRKLANLVVQFSLAVAAVEHRGIFK